VDGEEPEADESDKRMNATTGTITIAKLERFDYSQGDWHDAPLRYAVNGPSSECQKFSTKKAAQKYASLRRRSSDQSAAIKAYC